MSRIGSWSGLRPQRGSLVEYTAAPDALRLEFEFNPTTLTRSRQVTFKPQAPGQRGAQDFDGPADAARAAQGASVNAESLSLKILLDATDRMNAGDPVAAAVGVQPELDVIRSMLEPKTQTPGGARTLAALGQGDERAFARHESPSVLLFKWGPSTLPVLLTQASIELREFLPTLHPYRAEVSLQLQLIESHNPLYLTELKRQLASALRFANPS
jgi:hypothetical protein